MKSSWVQTETAKALSRETEDKRVLFPVRLIDLQPIKNWKLEDPDTGRDIAKEVRRYHIPDFSDWKNHDSYKKAFDLLLRDLNAKSVPPPNSPQP